MRARAFLGLTVVFMLATACAPGAAPGVGSGTDQGQPARAKTLILAEDQEPVPVVGGTGPMGAYTHHQLVRHDHIGNPLPTLITELPSLEQGTWVVNPDNTMVTTYKLRPNVLWHDGQRLSAQDFVFAWRVSNDAEVPIAVRRVAPQITQIDTPDDLTLLIRWKSLYPMADRISSSDLGPFPAHLLRDSYEADKAAFERHPYWRAEFVGVGPYRLAEWVPGSEIVLQRFDGYFGGRPKFDTIIERIITDERTIMANMLAGAVDGGFRSISTEAVLTVRDDMLRQGKKPAVYMQPTHFWGWRVQYDLPWQTVPELTDVRVRQALVHAIDRATMADEIYPGYGIVADFYIPPVDVKYEWVKDAVVRYPYDPRRAHELLAEAGLQRGTDGVYRNAAGSSIGLTLRSIRGGQWEASQAISAASWRQLGIREVEEEPVPHTRRGDNEWRAQFANLDGKVIAYQTPAYWSEFLISQCPRAPRWQGTNMGCYSDPAFDRVSQALTTAIQSTEQQRLYREMAGLYSRNLPSLPLFHHVQGTIFREGFTGFIGFAQDGGGGEAWNVLDWDVN